MVRWAWVAETVNGQALGELTEARGRRASFDLRGPCTAGFQVDGRSHQALGLTELATDLVVWRDQTRLFRGRLGSTDDDLDADRHTTTWSAVDYRGLLGARIDPPGRIWFEYLQDDIGWECISIAQSYDNGNLGITRGNIRPAAVVRTETSAADTPVDTVLDRFRDYADGFEYWIDPELRYQSATWRGVNRPDFPLVWGGTITALKRSYDTSLYANWVRVRGGRPDRPEPTDEEPDPPEPPEPVADRWASDLPVRREGRIMRVVNNSDLNTQETVDAAADQLLADSLNPPAAYTCTLTRGLWNGPQDVWLGDRVPLIVRSGRLNVAAQARVSQIDIELDDEGNETVQLTVGTGGGL